MKQRLMQTSTRGALAAALAAWCVASAQAGGLEGGLGGALAGARPPVRAAPAPGPAGPNSSGGVPYAKGMQAALAYQPAVDGRKVRLIVLDDGSDPSSAGRNARKLIEEEKVDLLMGTSGVPAAIAMAQVGKEAKTPMIGLTPILLDPNENPWVVTVAQPVQLMIDAVVERMQRNKVR